MQILPWNDPPFMATRPLFSVVLATQEGALGRTSRCLSRFGGQVEVAGEAYDALSQFADDPRAADLFVMDCDGFGGLDSARRMIGQLLPDERRAPVILITGGCREQSFPYRRDQPIILRAPVSSVAMRLALEASLKNRFPGMV